MNADLSYDNEENIALMICMRIFPLVAKAAFSGSEYVTVPAAWIDPVTLNMLKYRFGFKVTDTGKGTYVLATRYSLNK